MVSGLQLHTSTLLMDKWAADYPCPENTQSTPLTLPVENLVTWPRSLNASASHGKRLGIGCADRRVSLWGDLGRNNRATELEMAFIGLSRADQSVQSSENHAAGCSIENLLRREPK